MSGLPPGFQLDPPKPKGRGPRLDGYTPTDDVVDLGRSSPQPPILPGTRLQATGQVIDGDTMRLSSGRNGRLFGIDAFEKGQMGYRPGQAPINLGDLSAGSLAAYIRPSTSLIATGKQTFGRPVVTMGSGPTDPALPMLWQGATLAAPDFLKADPDRRAAYTEAERLARLNRQGAHGTQHLSPDVHRKADRWNLKLRPDESVEFTNDLPELRPEFQRLTDEEERDFFGFLASKSGDPKFSQADLDAYWKSKGRQASEAAGPEFIDSIRSGQRVGAIDYSAWDAATLADFKKQNAFAGMRPEVQEAYGSLLSSPAATPEQLAQFAEVNGMTFDPRDVSAFFEARKGGRTAPIPLPLINPGDGRTGAAARGFGDPLGFLDEMGAVPDALGLTDYRENIFNSDRSFGDIYRNNLRQNRAIIDYDETNHPYIRAAGQLVSGVALPFGGGVRGAAGFARAGAAEGAIYGFGSADGNLSQRLANIPLNAAAGAAVGATVGKALDVLSPAVRDGIARLRGGSSPPVPAAAPTPTAPAVFTPNTRGIEPGQGANDVLTSEEAAWHKVWDDTAHSMTGDAESEWDAVFQKTLDEIGAVDNTGTYRGALKQQQGKDGKWYPSGALEAAVEAADKHLREWWQRLHDTTRRNYHDDIPAPPPGFQIDRANMAADNAMPSLSSPRLPDVIDVNANRTTRLLDGPTPAMMNAAAARVEPGDVLPRPANEVQSLDEFGRISEGLYPGVRAPRERDYLDTRQFPSRANPENMLARKGPLDLAAYVRSEGGVADYRGELKAAGLSNAPRKGDDFAGGENRLGPLLDDERGASLDDMAQRAWEAGYFPDHATRPTVDEFVTALGDTYRGINRTFRPDDFAEIDAFNAARDQRLAVERARQEGAPLADDIGQPATLDDLIANTPPATAYDDWNNAVVSKVGNIDVRKLESPQDIGQALKVADNVAGGFDAARRGKISFAETQALAQDLGMTADDLLARRKGQAFSAEEAYAARAILAKSGNELVNMAKRIKALGIDPGSEALAEFRKALVRHTAIQEQVSGMTAEAGRALSAFRMAADSRDIPGRVLEGLASAGGGSKRLKDAAERIIDLERDPANLNRFIEQVSKPKFADRAQEIWYNYLLSGPQTHMVNMLSNTMTALGQIPEHAVAAGIGATRRAFSREAADRVLFSELGARSIGLLQGTKEGIREFARAFRTGEASDFVTKMESQTQKAVPGIKGEVLRVPTRLLTAEDELFKAMARRMELSGLAVRQAANEGRKGQEAKDRVAELVANPPDDMMEKVLDYGRYLTFQRPLGDGLAGTLSRYSQNHPLIKAILPFIRTPTNLIKFAAERSPLAPMVTEWRKDFMAGGARRDLAIAKVMVGSGVGAVIAELAAKGIITGSAPSDDNQRGLMLANGWQPYSIKIGDQYYSYRRLDPFAMTFGTAADLATMGEGMTEKQREKGAALWTASVVANLASRTWLSGVTDALEALQDPERHSDNFIKRLVGAATVPTGSAQIARTIDPTMREAPDIASYMSSRMPGQSDNLLPKRDVWGKPIVSDGGVGPDILSPIWTSTDRNDPITKEALRVDATISKPQKGDLTPDQYDRLQEVAGSVGRKWLGQLIASPEYQALDTESQADEIGDVMTRARKSAKAAVLTGEPIPDQRPEKKRSGSKRAAGLPEGFEVDPLPNGFVLDR